MLRPGVADDCGSSDPGAAEVGVVGRGRSVRRVVGALVAVVLATVVMGSASAAVGVTFTVNSTADGADASVGDGVCADATGACTFRAAIQESNASVGSEDTIVFNLPATPFSIAPTTDLPAITDPVDIDGTTQAGFVDVPIVEVRGDADATPKSIGLQLKIGGCTVRGLVVNRFEFTQIRIVSGSKGSTIVGNYIGTDITGSSPAGAQVGIGIYAGDGHHIGGSTPGDRNVVGGNTTEILVNSPAGKTTIQGNFIGTDASGQTAVAPSGGSGIDVSFAGPAVIGGPGPGEGNVISGHTGGIGVNIFSDLVFSGPGHAIVGNRIGTNVDGTNAVPNSVGIETEMYGLSSVQIAGNVVSGNRNSGINLREDRGSIIQGNMVGVDVSGLEAIPQDYGILLSETTGVLVGGTAETERNVISGNAAQGIDLLGQASANVIQGNYIGVGADGQKDLGNLADGISCCGISADRQPGQENLIGGVSAGAGNVIAYNGWAGIAVGRGSPYETGPVVSILGNSVYSNGNLGIELVPPLGGGGPTPNDSGDADAGPNDLQNFPVIESISSGGGQTVANASFNSTPNTDFRLEFFRNESCNQPASPSFLWYFGEGQTLVGAEQVTTDAAGDWSGAVSLAGATAPTEVITSTATRFTERGVSLAGSTSEFSECLANLSIAKTDEPDPVGAGQPLTYTIDVANAGPAPANEVRVTDTLPSGVTAASITASQGSCTRAGSTVTCLLGQIGRDGTARITVVIDPGSTPRTITNTTSVSSELRDLDDSDNSASESTQVATDATIIIRKEAEPDGSTQSFSFSGAITASLADGQSASETVTPGTHTVSESVPAGWDATNIECADPTGDSSGSAVPVGAGGTASATFRVVPGETVTCTFTNTQRGSVMLKKTTNGAINPSKDITFVLTGPELPGGGVTRSTFGDADGVLKFGGAQLVPGESYTVCEKPVPAGFTSYWKLDGEIVTPYNPNASSVPPADVGTRCYDFSVTAGQQRSFVVDNSHPGGEPRTIGYWKNWNRCTNGNQAATAAKNGGAEEGFFLVEDLLPQVVGDLTVSNCEQAVALLAKEDQRGKKKANDAAYELGAQLLAARFNAGAGAETCSAVQQAVVDGQALLEQINFTGSGDYLGSKSKDPLRPQALTLADTIDAYNNGNLC